MILFCFGDTNPLFIPPNGGKNLFFRSFFSPSRGDAAKRQRGLRIKNKPLVGGAAKLEVLKFILVIVKVWIIGPHLYYYNKFCLVNCYYCNLNSTGTII